jgi:hypothetical protein
MVTNKHKKRFVIDGYDGARRRRRRNGGTTGTLKGLGKTVLIQQAPNKLINLLKFYRVINGRYEGDAYYMRLFNKGDKLSLGQDRKR